MENRMANGLNGGIATTLQPDAPAAAQPHIAPA